MIITYDELIANAAARSAAGPIRSGRKKGWHQFRSKKLTNESKRKMTDDTDASGLGTYSRIVDAMIQVAS